MTKDKARKAAARARAAITGERYVVARRAVAQADAPVDGMLHRLTHRVPGVPGHVEGGLHGRPNTPHRHAARIKRQHGEPRVLIAWQQRIARLLRAE